ncbi:MAG: DNA polymerase IV [Myxococcota bacterium]
MAAARLCCLDLDTFFVSVERLLDPSLVGKPVVVGGRKGSRGVVTSCSYEVRPLGVRSGMPMLEAARLAPDATFVPTRHATYGPYAEKVRAVLDRFCPVVQTASIDEFFLDFHGCERLYHRPGDADADATIERVVREMREVIQAEVGLPASAGIGTTRAIAKMGSGRAKPAGVRMIRAGEERAFVDPLPVRRFPGIGEVAEAKLHEGGVFTLGQLLDGHRFPELREFVREGISRGGPLGKDRPAFREHDTPGPGGSISNERTFFADVGERQVAEDELRALCERVTWRARKRGIRARTISLKLRYADFETLSRSRTIEATDEEERVREVATQLLRDNWTRATRVRLLGVALHNLVGADPQLALPFGPARPRTGAAIDAVRARFGYDAIRLGVAGDRRDWSG